MLLFQTAFFFLVIVPSAIIHEYAHGWAADRLGDPTAKYAGRLTLDPRAHLDKWGTILMPLLLIILTQGRFMFAYAKPVPYNPYNLKDQRWGPVWVAIAGPMANFILAFTFALILKFAPQFITLSSTMIEYITIIIYANVLLMVFNLVPIPPLDGSKVLYAVLPDSAYKVKQFLEKNSFIILLIFIFFLIDIISPIITKLTNLLINL